MKPHFMDVPVKINIWIRPILQRKQDDVVERVRPGIVFSSQTEDKMIEQLLQ